MNECEQICYQQWVDMYNVKDKECFDLQLKLSKIEKVITEFSKEDIITLPDLTTKDNYNLIAKQYAESITKILKIIRGEE